MMKRTQVLAGLLIVVGSMAPAHGASQKDVVTPAGYAYQPNISDYYPPQSRQAGEEGMVKVRACYDIKGRIQSSEIDESSGFARLDEAAIRASRDFLIKPGTINGIPQESCAVLPMKFALKGPTSPAELSAALQKAREANGPKDQPTSTELTYMPTIRSIYPSESKKQGEEGTPVVVVCYDAKGKIVSSELYSSSGFERLDQAAVSAGRKFRLKPATVDGVRQAGCGAIPLKFSLDR